MLNLLTNSFNQITKNFNRISVLLILVFLFFSCTENKIKKIDTNILKSSTNKTLNLWLNNYIKVDKNFSLDNFNFFSEDTISFIEGNVFGKFDNEFNPVYLPFLIYSKNKQKYIDIDSYKWTVDEDNEIIFSADQEIDLVDLQNKTVTRIGFEGPSQWVEEAYWESDSVVVLLENNYENIPVIAKLNINNGLVKIYRYNSVIDTEVYYPEKRITEKIQI